MVALAQNLAIRRATLPWLPPLLVGGAAAVLLLVAIMAVGYGSSSLGLVQVVATLAGYGDSTQSLIVFELRLPRVLLAAEAGMCLALAGALLQAATRNPLASPAILGIVDGAALGVVAFLFLFSNESNALTVSIHFQPVAAVCGALVFTLAVAWFTWRDGRGPTRIILYGIAFGALASAIVTVLIIVGPVYRANQALTWLAGSVHAAHWQDVAVIAALLVVLLPILGLVPRAMDQLALDDHSAAATGLTVTPTLVGLMSLSVALTATAVSFVGGVAFVGLIAPHLARLLVGYRAVPLLIMSALIGATIVVGADLAGRVAFAPLEVPTGAITALVGAPYFIWLLISRSRSHA